MRLICALLLSGHEMVTNCLVYVRYLSTLVAALSNEHTTEKLIFVITPHYTRIRLKGEKIYGDGVALWEA